MAILKNGWAKLKKLKHDLVIRIKNVLRKGRRREPKNIQLVYSYGYSFSQHLVEHNIKRISVYCEKNAWKWAQSIIVDLSMSMDVSIRNWISDSKLPTNDVGLALTNAPRFTTSGIDDLGADDFVLILSSRHYSKKIKQICSRPCKTAHILDIKDEVMREASGAYIGKRLAELRALHPFLPIVLFPEPANYPKNVAEYSEIEKYMAANQYGHYDVWYQSLKNSNARVPRTYEEFDYSVDDLIEMLDPTRTMIQNNQVKSKDYAGKYVNVINGQRVVPNQPNAPKTIYALGGCMTFGTGCPDGGTWPAYLQQLLLDSGDDSYRVENHGAFIAGREKYMLDKMMMMPYKHGDILIYCISHIGAPRTIPKQDGCFYLETKDLFERPHNWGDNVFLDTCHPNEHGQLAIAKTLFSFMQANDCFSSRNHVESFPPPHTHAQEKSRFVFSQLSDELEEYKRSLDPLKPQIGAIVMNCNPFTLGHRYLIEQSAAKVDKLFIFVVEEDRSFFPFADRLTLVKKGTSDLKNVTVVPSGKFIISSITFDDYFGKESKQENENIDASYDVEIFAQHIAPTLGITIRFAGEEPLDKVTLQYNKTMERVLPKYGITFEVIPRKESDGQPISASRVRKLLEEGKLSEIAKIVPTTTYEYLKAMKKD